jgi:hypothetical protein
MDHDHEAGKVQAFLGSRDEETAGGRRQEPIELRAAYLEGAA